MRIQTRQFATLVILLISLLLSPVTLAAQTTNSDWSRLTSVSTGSKLSVKLRNGKKLDGTLSSVSDTALTLLVKNTSTELKRDDIRTVHQVNGNSAKKATLIGLGLGAGAGATVGAAIDRSNDDGFEKLDSVGTAVTTVLGAGVGALGGFLIGRSGKKRVLLYEAK
jgi:small nuclear ribonucleoprotein (snRNP)-like protein